MRKGLRNWNKSRGRGGKRIGNRVLLGLAGSSILFIGYLSGISYLIGNGTLPIEKASLIGKAGLALASFVGCFLAAKLSEKKRLLNAAIVGCLLLIISSGMNGLLNGMDSIRIWIPTAICACSVLTASWFSIWTKGNHYKTYVL